METCGIYTRQGQVITLKNISPSPEDSYEIDLGELVAVLLDLYGDKCKPADFVVWHTHPSGQIGPSKGDMDQRLDAFQYYVIALPNGEGTIF